MSKTTGRKRQIRFYLIGGIMALGVYGLGYQVEQSDFSLIICFYSLAFAGYLSVLFDRNRSLDLRQWLGLAILLRLLLVFAMPALSDDVYRFIWDGRLLINGISPFAELPTYYMEPGNSVPGLERSLFNALNSPEYFTIYPPVAQGSFVLACRLFFDDVLASTIVLKAILWGFEVGIIILLPRLLRKLGLPAERSLIYALNPLVIVELVGNLHYEGVMFFFLLAAIWYLYHKRLAISALLFALSVASKLLPLLFLPYLWSRLGWKKSSWYYLIVGAAVVLLFLPLFAGVGIDGFRASLDLYFRKFEFNASIYYLIRWVGYQLVGYNVIQIVGPKMGLVVMLTIGITALTDKGTNIQSLFPRMLFAICLYLSVSTTIHPWYTVLPLGFCLFTSWRFPVVWTGLAFLTYINYSYQVYRENLWIVGLEYLIVYGFFIWEAYRKPPVLQAEAYTSA